LSTRGVMCGTENGGVPLETVDAQTYDQCFRFFERNPGTSCNAINPCARDGNGNLTGYFCCIQLGTAGNCGRTGNDPIFLVDYGSDCGDAGSPCSGDGGCVPPLHCVGSSCQ
jgi:hypothetical protein